MVIISKNFILESKIYYSPSGGGESLSEESSGGQPIGS